MQRYFLTKRLLFWIFLFVAIIAGLSLFYFKPNTIKNSPSGISERPRSGTCLILEQKYCSQGKILNSENLAGTKIKLLGFHLPEGAPIFAPYNGSLSTGKGNTFNKDSLNATVSNPDDQSIPVFTVIGDLRYPSSSSFYPVKKGEIVAYAQNAGITVLGDYNVVITFSIKDPNKGTLGTDEAILKQLFPNLFQ
ncbi:MAG: hypothetical protein A2958_02455 [Candidatus Levybacteria bacterium RIFCSPLOWO2_01_FULL_38_13]|nr:MAG: hypothetical protein A2958_02455 [Candidatus Levybacteria bacterium RIFCSPLOWO2_01_FULL_38_13]